MFKRAGKLETLLSENETKKTKKPRKKKSERQDTIDVVYDENTIERQVAHPQPPTNLQEALKRNRTPRSHSPCGNDNSPDFGVDTAPLTDIASDSADDSSEPEDDDLDTLVESEVHVSSNITLPDVSIDDSQMDPITLEYYQKKAEKKHKRRNQYVQEQQKIDDFWTSNRAKILYQFMISETTVDQTNCNGCKEEDGIYVCRTCSPVVSFCKECLLSVHPGILIMHQFMVVDRYQGLIPVDIGTAPIDTVMCACEDKHHREHLMKMVSLEVTREVNLSYCTIHSSVANELICHRFFPSPNNSIVFSFDILNIFRRINLQSGLSQLAFIHSVAALQPKYTSFKTLYKPFLAAFTEYRMLMLQLETMQPMKLSHFFRGCHACPSKAEQPGAMNWAADGNFRSFRYRKNNIPRELPFMHYMLDPKTVKERLSRPYIKDTAHDPFCSDFRAFEKNLGAKFKTFEETGVFGICCARHETILTATDMYTGERFLYLDSLLEELLKDVSKDRHINIYYDIACKYQSHTKLNPDTLPFFQEFVVNFLIPVFHIYGHGAKCIDTLHPLLHQLTGLTDGEVNERIWSHTNLFFKSLKEMKSENRRTLLEDVFHFLWSRSQDKVASIIQKKIVNVLPKIEYLESVRSQIEFSDADLDEKLKLKLSRSIQSSAQRFETFFDAQVYVIDSKIQRLQLDIWMSYSIINRRHADKEFHKQRKNLHKQISKYKKSILNLLKERNEMVLSYLLDNPDKPLTALKYEDITNKTSDYWKNSNSDIFGSSDLKTWVDLKRHKEEYMMLNQELEVWKENIREKILILKERITVDAGATGIDPDRLNKAANCYTNQQIQHYFEIASKAGLTTI